MAEVWSYLWSGLRWFGIAVVCLWLGGLVFSIYYELFVLPARKKAPSDD